MRTYSLKDVDDDHDFPHYFGYVTSTGDWYIIKVNKNGVLQYYDKPSKSLVPYASAWDSRDRLTYSFNICFSQEV